MVAKHMQHINVINLGLNLAKIHMVAKPSTLNNAWNFGLNLAKIHMVAKLLKVFWMLQ